MTVRKQKRVRRTAGWICLVAVAFMYAPLAGALVFAHSLDCCVDGYCKVPAHHHPQKKLVAPQTASLPESDCGHGGGADHGAMTRCAVSCCPDSAHSAFMPTAFVLPVAISVSESHETIRPIPAAHTLEVSRFAAPPSPPPRFFSFAL